MIKKNETVDKGISEILDIFIREHNSLISYFQYLKEVCAKEASFLSDESFGLKNDINDMIISYINHLHIVDNFTERINYLMMYKKNIQRENKIDILNNKEI